MDKITLTFPAQSLTLFRRSAKRDDGTTSNFWAACLDTVPLNDLGATQAEFTGRDLTPGMIAALKPLKVGEGTSKDADATPFKFFGLVKITAEVVAPRAYTTKDGRQIVTVRISPTAIERVEDTSLADIDAI